MGMLYKQKGSKNWWMKYYRNGRPIRESTGTDKETEAKRKLREKEGDIAAGRPVIPHADRVRFEDLAEDFLNDYRVNDKRSLERAERSVELLKTYFASWKAVSIPRQSRGLYARWPLKGARPRAVGRADTPSVFHCTWSTTGTP